jgi:GntR family transcriptional regulator
MWRDDQPIYRQLKDRIKSLVLAGTYLEGEALPSVRNVASEYQINHLTVAKAYQELVDEMIVEKRRGLGMFVLDGAREALLASEKAKFFDEELPLLLQRIEQLGINAQELAEKLTEEK